MLFSHCILLIFRSAYFHQTCLFIEASLVQTGYLGGERRTFEKQAQIDQEQQSLYKEILFLPPRQFFRTRPTAGGL